MGGPRRRAAGGGHRPAAGRRSGAGRAPDAPARHRRRGGGRDRWLAANGGPEPPFAIEAESGGGRISLWLTVDHPELVARLVLASVASETPPASAMAARMARWIEMAEADDWGTFFGNMAAVMKPASGGEAPSFEAAARLQPRPATPERFIGELRATLDPSSFVTDRLREIGVPALVLAGGQDQVVPIASSRLVAERDSRRPLRHRSGVRAYRPVQHGRL